MAQNFMDCGFDWNQLNGSGVPPTDSGSPCTMSFGFGGTSMPSNSSDGGYVQKGSTLSFNFYEVSNTPDVKLKSVTISIVKSPDSTHSHDSPFDTSTLTLTAFHGPNLRAVSSPLNTTATGWSTGDYTVLYEGAFLITVTLSASVNDEVRYYDVDPELVVGTKAQGSIASSH